MSVARTLQVLRANRSGAAAAEMALVTPLLMALLFATMEGSRYFLDEHVVLKAVRDGARFASRQTFSAMPCGGTSTKLGEISIHGVRHTVDAVDPMISRQWIYSTTPQSVQYLDATTPIGGGACGRVVLSDIHVSQGGSSSTEDDSDPSLPYPDGCRTTELSPQEKALEFMIFDLSSCVEIVG